MFAYGQDNRWYDQYFEKGMSVSGETETKNALAAGSHQGALAITVAAAEAGSVAAGTLTFTESDSEDGPFETPAGAPVLTVESASPEAGDVIAVYVLPNCKRYVKARLGGGWPAGVDVYLSCLAR